MVAISEAVNRVPVETFLFLPDLDGGGAQRTLVNLANSLPRDRVSPTLVAGRADGAAREWLAPDTPLMDLEAGRLLQALRPLRRLLRHRRPSVLLSTIADANALAWMASLGLGTKRIFRETNSHRSRDDLSAFRRLLISISYRQADAVVALSEGVGRELIQDYRLDSGRTHTIHNPVDISLFNSSDAAANEIPVDKGSRLILGIGRLTRQKNFELLLRAFAKLSDRGSRLVLLGDGPDRTKLENLAQELKIQDRVAMPGFTDDTRPWLARADLFVLSSLWEGFGHVLVEAMAAGTPVLSTDCPHGPRDIIEDQVSGRLIANNSVQDMWQGMEQLLGDPVTLQRLGAAGKTAAKRFAAEKIAGDYADLIERVAAG